MASGAGCGRPGSAGRLRGAVTKSVSLISCMGMMRSSPVNGPDPLLSCVDPMQAKEREAVTNRLACIRSTRGGSLACIGSTRGYEIAVKMQACVDNLSCVDRMR